MKDILEISEIRKNKALEILEKLDLLNRWSRYGKPYLLGSVKMGLVWKRDIDMNIYCKDPKEESGNIVMAEIASLPGVEKIEFHNFLDTPDMGLYWKIFFRDDEDEIWTLDNWLVSFDHPDAGLGEDLAEKLLKVLTPEYRRRILIIKSQVKIGDGIRGVDVYQGVIQGKVENVEEFLEWFSGINKDFIVQWKPE